MSRDQEEAQMALDPSETVILIEATYQAKPPKDRIMRVPMRIPPITVMGKLLSSSTSPIMTSSSQLKKTSCQKHNRRPEATIVHCARVPRVDHG